ncbi:quinon protein alcohol dehydrogenase-like superfamily [Mycotypha africana]|uniref:quinon protein alcohol dehydrogenase-like superfamily n=1 Tax=Mycotypha africana TaxID=64632 RepID=UPI002300C479|nr:quinon protein alcohol dehydrogenase-like superfamily [Mycotypha africana]KAI8983927.1 quinon protein alcohol dehydrogenase-like superfamily [Mycotypha africana]
MSFHRSNSITKSITTEDSKESLTEQSSINNLSAKTTYHDLLPVKKGKRKYRLSEVDPSKPCFVHQLSVELITHIFARLDPVSLAVAAEVCTYWKYIIMDDSCWRNAFVSYFGVLPYKRLSIESWKTEYILRTHLVRKWTKGRGMIMSFDPKIGSLEKMQVDFEASSMIVASTEHGVAARCNPMTGKVAQRHLYYSTNEHVRQEISCVEMDKDRILWGFGQGYITLNTRTKSTTSRRKTFSEFHQGSVCALSLPQHVQDVVLSGSEEDGTVKIWDVSTALCVWTFYPESATVKKPTVIKTTADHQLLIGYDDGSIIIWKLNLNLLLQIHRNFNGQELAQKKRNLREFLEKDKIAIAPLPIIRTDSARLSVRSMSYDNETNTVIVAYLGKTDVLKYSTLDGKCVSVFSAGHTAANSITCMKWDKQFSGNTYSLASVVKPRSAVDNGTTSRKTGSNVIDLSSASVNSNKSTASSAPSSGMSTPISTTYKTTRLLVTGDDLGTVCVWNGDAVTLEEGRIIKPLHILSGHIVPISAIHIDACKIVTGSDDGWIRVWEPLTGEIITTFGNKIPKHAPVDRSDVNLMRVKNLFCNDYQGIATIGHQVKCWDFSPGQQNMLSRRAMKHKNKPYNIALREKLKNEIFREAKESIEKLKTEQQELERTRKELDKLSLGGLSDDEMLAYALMLSSQQEATFGTNSDMTAGIMHESDYVDDEDEELMEALIASLEHRDAVITAQKTDFHDTDENEARIQGSSNAASSNTQGLPDDSTTLYHDIENWPTVEEAATTLSSPQVRTEDEDIDDELRYVLELSKHDK